MDTLSHMLRTLHTRSPLVADLRLGDDISIGLPALGGLPFHYIVSGACHLDPGDERLSLVAGDFVMLARLPYYRFETGNGARRVEVMDYAQRDNFSIAGLRTGKDHLLARMFGEAPIAARIFSAIVMPADGEASPLTRELPPVTLLRNVRSLLEPWLVAAIDFMAMEAREPELGSSAIAERLIEVIFIAMLRKWVLEGAHQKGWMRGLTDTTISRVLDAIHAEPGRRWTLRDLAIAAGRSRSGLASHFRDVMDETPFAYLTRWRMHLAASALTSGKRSLADIGVSLGYGGSTAFSRAFIAEFGATPAAYRKRSRADAIARKADGDGTRDQR